MNKKSVFSFKRFQITQNLSAVKVGTDGVVLGAWTDVPVSGNILDVGSGTGLISIMLAQRSNNCDITAIEIENNAYNESVNNVNHCNWNDRISVLHIGYNDYINQNRNKKFDLIVSNPPFFIDSFKSTNDKLNIARHNVSLNPVLFVEDSSKIISENGIISLIAPFEQFEEITYKAYLKGLNLYKHTDVISVDGNKPFRVLLEYSKQRLKEIHNTLIIRDISGKYTEQYLELTKDFYLFA